MCAPNKPLEGLGGREEGKENDLSAHLSYSGQASTVPIKHIVLYEICSFSMVSDSREKTVGGAEFGAVSGNEFTVQLDVHL